MKIVYTLAAVALLAGCNRREPPIAEFNPPVFEYTLPGGTHVHEFILKDGTRCVLTYLKESITCEWQHPVVIVPRPQ